MKHLATGLKELGLHNNYEAKKVLEDKYEELSSKSISDLKKDVSRISLAEFLLVAGFVSEKEDSLLALKIYSSLLTKNINISGALAEVSVFDSDIYKAQIRHLAKSRISYNLKTNKEYVSFLISTYGLKK